MGGAIVNFQRAFWHGEADSSCRSRAMILSRQISSRGSWTVLLATSELRHVPCGRADLPRDGDVVGRYPPEHRLEQPTSSRRRAALHVMQRYTSSPSFWGIYRRESVDQLAPDPIPRRMGSRAAGRTCPVRANPPRAGSLYWRRDGGRAVATLARAATEQGNRGVPVDQAEADQRGARR